MSESNKVAWNDYKTKLKNPIKPGQVVVYELVGIKNNPLAHERVEPELPVMKGVPAKDRIIEGDGDDTVVTDIAYIKSFGAGNVPSFGVIRFTKQMGGKLAVNGSKADDRKLYEYLERSNRNASNPNRDTSVTPIFNRVDHAADRKKKSLERKDRLDAMNAAGKLTAGQVSSLSTFFGITGADKDEIMSKIEDFAETNPTKFLESLENPDLTIVENASQAIKAGLISIDAHKRRILSGTNEVLYAWAPEKDATWQTKIIDFVKTEEGREFYKELQSSLKKK